MVSSGNTNRCGIFDRGSFTVLSDRAMGLMYVVARLCSCLSCVVVCGARGNGSFWFSLSGVLF